MCNEKEQKDTGSRSDSLLQKSILSSSTSYSHFFVGSAVMLCLLGNASQLRPLSSVSCFIHFSFVPCLMYFPSHVFCVSFISCLMYSASHLFCVPSLSISFCSMPYLFHVSAQIVSQLSGRSGCSGRVSTFGSCLKSCLDSSHVSQSVVRNKD